MTDFIDVLEQQLVAAHARDDGRRRRFAPVSWRPVIVFAGAVAAAAVVVAAVLALSSPQSQPAPSPATEPPQTTPVHPPPPVRLAVLNGTTVTGLARVVADELVSKGYHAPVLVTNDATNPSRRRTVVDYRPGHKGDAQAVAGCLEVGLDRVRPMDTEATLQAIRADDIDVAVYVGADRVR